MNEYNNFGYTNTDEGGEPDYYAMYVNEKNREAKRVFSKYHMSLFIFTVISYAVIIEKKTVSREGKRLKTKFIKETFVNVGVA